MTNTGSVVDCCNVTMTVTAVPDAPTCTNDICFATEDGPAVNCDILGNDNFPDDDGSFISGPTIIIGYEQWC